MGRPPKPESQRRRNNVTIRMRDSVKKNLQVSAESHGRSLSEEIEWRLEQSFRDDAMEMLTKKIDMLLARLD